MIKYFAILVLAFVGWSFVIFHVSNHPDIFAFERKDLPETKSSPSDIVYTDGWCLTVSGRIAVGDNYQRLPARYKDIVRPPVWALSQHSAGVNIRFYTDSPEIWVKWELMNFSPKANMTSIGASGLDLYCKRDQKWQYVNSGIPKEKETETVLITHMDGSLKEFMLNLPLYAGVVRIEIGIKKGFVISKGEEFRNHDTPIVVYGTSITQGASASRPGMAYPSIISRNLDLETINLGFSGNGKFENSIGQVLCDISPGILVLDCTPNSSPEVIEENTLDLIQQFRTCHPEVPILMVESIIREYSYFKQTDATVFGTGGYIKKQNRALLEAFREAKNSGIKDLYYLEGKDLIGSDHEGTVDGTHLNDLGMVRIAEAVQAELVKILND